jgi:hypothetical protein
MTKNTASENYDVELIYNCKNVYSTDSPEVNGNITSSATDLSPLENELY